METQTRKEGSLSRYVIDRGVVRSDRIFKRHLDYVEGGVTKSITLKKQAGTPAAPWGTRSHLQSPLGVQKSVRGMASGWIMN